MSWHPAETCATIASRLKHSSQITTAKAHNAVVAEVAVGDVVAASARWRHRCAELNVHDLAERQLLAVVPTPASNLTANVVVLKSKAVVLPIWQTGQAPCPACGKAQFCRSNAPTTSAVISKRAVQAPVEQAVKSTGGASAPALVVHELAQQLDWRLRAVRLDLRHVQVIDEDDGALAHRRPKHAAPPLVKLPVNDVLHTPWLFLVPYTPARTARTHYAVFRGSR